MGHFSNNKTEMELFIEENFNFEDNNPYTYEIEDEGEFVKINSIENNEETNGDTISSKRELPSE
jgi:hypothetical protein